MKITGNIKEKAESKKIFSRAISELTIPVEISGDGEYLYITKMETDPKSNLEKGFVQ